MASATVTVSATLTCVLTSIRWSPNGDYLITFDMQDTNGATKRSHSFVAKGDGTGVYDEVGNTISATTPATLLTNLGNVKTNIDSALNSAATVGKISF